MRFAARGQGRRAFTLMELLVSFLLVGLVLAIVVNLYPMSYLTMRRGERLLVADGMAQDVLEEARVLPYESLLPEDFRLLDPITLNQVEYRRSRAVRLVSGLDLEFGKEVVVRVEWTDGTRGRQQVTHRIVRSHVSP